MAISHLYPTQRPALDLNFARQKRLDSRVTFTRGSTATYVGSDGLIKTAAANEARFDHDPATGESLGLLVEESRTNLFTYSEQFNESAWSKTRITVSANSITAPDGTLTADKIIENVGSSQDYILNRSVTSLVATYTYSFFAKAGERKHIRISRSTGNQTTFTHYYTLEDSGTATGGGNIESYANGWYRCYGQTEVTSAGTAGFALRLENSSTNSIYDGDGTSGIYLWGAQYEQGAFVASYIPTTTASVTRSADVASMTGTNFSSWYNQSEGTFLMKSAYSENPYANIHRFEVYRNGAANTDLIAVVSAYPSEGYTRLVSLSNSVGTSLGLYVNNTWTNKTSNHIAVALETNNCSIVSGSAIGTDTTSTFPQNLDAFGFGAPSNTVASNQVQVNIISRITYYPYRLSNDQLQALTL